jgi:hypothetical protein
MEIVLCVVTPTTLKNSDAGDDVVLLGNAVGMQGEAATIVVAAAIIKAQEANIATGSQRRGQFAGGA